MLRAKLTIVLTLMLTFLGASVVTAQEDGNAEEESRPYWYISHYKVSLTQLDSLNTLMEEYGNDIAEQAIENGDLLDYKMLFHHTATEYNVVVMRLHESWDDINDGPGFGEAMEEVIPDEELRQKVGEGFGSILTGKAHKDDIYTEVTE